MLDLDHTLADFRQARALDDPHECRRPGLLAFLARVHAHYDLAVWSATRWWWLEVKLVELGLLGGAAAFSLCFVLERDAMVKVPLTRRGPPPPGASSAAAGALGGAAAATTTTVEVEVEPLELVWRQCGGRWGPHNTLHVDDLPHTYARARALRTRARDNGRG